MLARSSSSACGSDAAPQSENYGNILASPGGLVVLEEEHPTGWMRSDCFGCHNVNNIHQVNRTGLPDDEVDLAGVRAIVHNEGESSCMMCHGIERGAAVSRVVAIAWAALARRSAPPRARRTRARRIT